MTFWDAGELIAAVHTLGVPHPPGTPLYVALAHVWTSAVGALFGVARAANLLSAACTALAGAGTAWLIARRVRSADGAWTGVVGAVAAGTMLSVWSNATETEVYAVALLHAVAMLIAGARAGEGTSRDDRWLLLTAYLIALAPAAHLSALVAAPAATALAARELRPMGERAQWHRDRVLLLGGVLLASAGVGRVQWPVVASGIALVVASVRWRPHAPTIRRAGAAVVLTVVGASALLILIVRARHDPGINQGNPSTLPALADVVARRQYDVAPVLPRSAPVWLQLANVFQYMDWQAAMSWGYGIMTSPARVLATVLWLALGGVGLRAMRRESPALADALAVLAASGTFGVAAYLNLRAGASLGWGILPDATPHEARERDYFFILGFWAWGCLAGAGAVTLVRRRGLPSSAALLALALPIAGNWRSADRSREPEATAARRFGLALLEATPPGAVLFLDGDNDSYPIWYLQQVEGTRRDVLPVTIPLLPAGWYPDELARRSGLRWPSATGVAGASTLSEQRAALIAAAAYGSGRPVAASPALSARERRLLGADWVLRGPVYVARAGGRSASTRASIDSGAAVRWAAGRLPWPAERRELTGDNVARVMSRLLDCPRLALSGGSAVRRDSLEVRCNLR